MVELAPARELPFAFLFRAWKKQAGEQSGREKTASFVTRATPTVPALFRLRLRSH